MRDVLDDEALGMGGIGKNVRLKLDDLVAGQERKLEDLTARYERKFEDLAFRYEQQLQEGEIIRKKLHNVILVTSFLNCVPSKVIRANAVSISNLL